MANAEAQGALNDVMQLLEANLTAPHHRRCPWFLLMILQLNARGWQFWFRLANQKKLSAFSSRTIR